MNRGEIVGTLVPASPRYLTWQRIFGSTTVPLESGTPAQGILPGLGERAIYKCAVARLSPEQRERLERHLVERFHLPYAEVRADLDGPHGLPVLAEDVVVGGALRSYL
jgi:hypothetical protein